MTKTRIARPKAQALRLPNELGMLTEAHRAAVEDGDIILAQTLFDQMKKYERRGQVARTEEIPVEPERKPGSGYGHGRPQTQRMMTQPQKGKIYWLLTQVPAAVAATARPWFEERLDTLTAAQASDVITRLKAHVAAAPEALEMPVQEAAPAPRTFRPITLPDGYYAIVTDGKTHFYRVSTWETRDGQKRRKMQEQASDTLHYVRWPNALHIQDLIIAAGVDASQKLYATELGCCYICGRTLTDDESRAMGIGPTCRKKNR